MDGSDDPMVLEREYEVFDSVETGDVCVWICWSVKIYTDEPVSTVKCTVAIEPRNFDELRNEGTTKIVSVDDVPSSVFEELATVIDGDRESFVRTWELIDDADTDDVVAALVDEADGGGSDD